MQNNAGPRRSCSGSDKKMEPQTQSTPVLVTHLSKGLGPWKIPSQGVYGRSMVCRNENNKNIGLSVFEIRNIGKYLNI